MLKDSPPFLCYTIYVLLDDYAAGFIRVAYRGGNPMSKIVRVWNKTSLILKIAIGIVIGAALGLLCPKAEPIGYLGTLFVSALKAIAPILVFVLVMSSLSKAGTGIGSKFKNVIILYLVSTLVSACIAVIVHFVWPLTVALNADTGAVASAPQPLGTVFKNLLTGIVENPIGALSGGNYLGILFWAVVIGLGLKVIGDETTIHVLEKLSDTVSLVVNWVIQCAPFGILGIVFQSVAESGLSIFTSYGMLILQLVLTMLFVLLVSNPFIVHLCTRENPYPLILTCLRESGISAFFTRSSAANIPVNMKLCEKLGLDRDFYSVSIPLGATINMDGAAVVITIMSLTLANTLGIKVSISSAMLLAMVATLAACGSSGVAGGSLLLIPMACSLLGISQEFSMQMVAIGFVISVIQDSLETALNSTSDVVFTATAEKMAQKKK